MTDLIQALKQCRDALAAMESEKSDYMIRNKLGNPAVETTNRMARSAITAADTALAALSEPQDERAAFEAWIWKDSTLSVNRSGGGYDNMSTALLWSAWQARASLAPAQQPALAQQVPEPQPEYNTPVFDEAAYKRDVSAQAAQWAAQQVPAVPATAWMWERGGGGRGIYLDDPTSFGIDMNSSDYTWTPLYKHPAAPLPTPEKPA